MKIKRILNRFKREMNLDDRIKKSQWYHTIFPHLSSFENIKRNSDIICLGSTPARYSIDFANTNVIGSNLAVLPETVFYDFQVLKNYHSFLKKEGVVMLVLCPFTLLKDKYTVDNGNDNYLNIRYYPILHRAMIDNYKPELFDKWVEHPKKMGFKVIFKSFMPSFLINRREKQITNALELKKHADSRVERWMQEFGLKSLTWNDCSSQIKKSVTDNISIYKNMVEFVKERNYKIVFVVPPFSKELTDLLPQEFVESSLLSPLNELGVPVISYWNIPEWQRKEYFRDSFTMSPIGRKKLTIDIINYLRENRILSPNER